jgi:1-deoxy-D-xylulose-5-phosphate synthase
LGVRLKPSFDQVPVGKAETLRSGHDVALAAIGTMVQPALRAAELLQVGGISCEVVNMRFVKPLDTELLDNLARRFSHLVTVEDNVVTGGFGGGVAEYYAGRSDARPRVRIHGIPDRFIDHGTPAELYKELHLDADGIAQVVKGFLSTERPKTRQVIKALTS